MTTESNVEHSPSSQSPADKTQIRKWAASASLVIVGCAGLVGAFQLGVGSGAVPGPGMWPAIISAVILTCGLVMGPQSDAEGISRNDAAQALSALLLLALFIILFSVNGIFFPTLIVLSLWLKFLAGRTWLKSVLIAAATAVSFYLIFTLLFGVGS